MKKAILILILLTSILNGNITLASETGSHPYLRYVEQADSLIKLEKWDEAEVCLRNALRTEPANPGNQMLLINMGMILTAQGKYGDAIRHLDTVIGINPNSFLAYKNRALAYSAMKLWNEAEADFSAALEIDSLANDVRCLRATTNTYLGNLPEAKKDFNLVLSKEKDSLSALEGLFYCAIIEEKYDDAVPFLNQLIDLKTDPDLHFFRGLALSKLGRLSEASEDVAKGLLLDPSSGNLWLLRAYIEKISYRLNEAKASLAKARKFGADRELESRLLPDL